MPRTVRVIGAVVALGLSMGCKQEQPQPGPDPREVELAAWAPAIEAAAKLCRDIDSRARSEGFNEERELEWAQSARVAVRVLSAGVTLTVGEPLATVQRLYGVREEPSEGQLFAQMLGRKPTTGEKLYSTRCGTNMPHDFFFGVGTEGTVIAVFADD